MASTIISDVVVPSVFAPYVQELSLELSLLVRTGVIARSQQLDAFLSGGGQILDVPAWEDLSDTEPNISSDSGTATPLNIGSNQAKAVRVNQNQAWGSMDLSSQLAGSDPMDAIARRVAAYWTRAQQARLLATVKGLADNNASIVNDISDAGTDNNAAADAANLVSADAFLDTFQLLGDHKTNISAIAMHSVVHTNLQKQNLIDFIPDSEGNVGFGTYLGKTVLVDDGMITQADASLTEYYTIAFGAGAFQLGVGSPRVGAEVERNALAGSGGGEEILVSRTEYCLHPQGFTAVAANIPANNSSWSNSELEDTVAPAYEFVDATRRKAVPLAVLKSNG